MMDNGSGNWQRQPLEPRQLDCNATTIEWNGLAWPGMGFQVRALYRQDGDNVMGFSLISQLTSLLELRRTRCAIRATLNIHQIKNQVFIINKNNLG